MLILADAIRSVALQENSSLSVNLNKFLDLFPPVVWVRQAYASGILL
jgi:hypothetical protein